MQWKLSGSGGTTIHSFFSVGGAAPWGTKNSALSWQWWFWIFFLSFGSKTEVFHPPQWLFTEKVLSVCCTSIWISQEFLPKSRPVYLCKNKTAVIFKRLLMWLCLESIVGCYFKENKFILTWACALVYSSVDKILHGHLSWRLSVSEISLIFHSERKMHQTCNVPMMCEP